MNHDTDADPDAAPDAIDHPLGRTRRVPSLPGPRPESFPPALGSPTPTVEPSSEGVPASEVSLSRAHVYVTLELPDAAKDTLEIEATDRTLRVHAQRSGGEPFRLEIELPSAVDAESTKATYRNGVLDVTLIRTSRERGGPHDE